MTTWTPATEQAETWTSGDRAVTTWASVTEQTETWTSGAPSRRVFSRDVFAHYPIFDTGSVAGTWTKRTEQAETWTSA